MKRFALLACIGVFGMTQLSSAAIITRGVINPNPGGQTIQDSPNNVGNANFVTQSAMSTLISTAFANDTGGVMNFDNVDGWTANGSATSWTVNHGNSAINTLTLGRNDGGNGFGSTSGSGTTPTSGGQYLAFQGSGSPITLTFSQGLSAWGMTQLNRNSSRDVTMSFTLADNSVINYALQNQDPNSNNTGALNWYGFQATNANPLKQVTITANGFTRYDDMAFVVAVPEPAGLSVLGLGAFVACRRKRK